MNSLFLILHVLTAVLFLGPVAVSTSVFPRHAMEVHEGHDDHRLLAKKLYTITKTYGLLSLLVPLLGVGVMIQDFSSWKSNGVLHAAIALSVAAWAVLFFLIVPRHKAMVLELGLGADEEETVEAKPIANWHSAKKQLTILAGIFNGLWLVIFLMMAML